MTHTAVIDKHLNAVKTASGMTQAQIEEAAAIARKWVAEGRIVIHQEVLAAAKLEVKGAYICDVKSPFGEFMVGIGKSLPDPFRREDLITAAIVGPLKASNTLAAWRREGWVIPHAHEGRMGQPFDWTRTPLFGMKATAPQDSVVKDIARALNQSL